MRPKLSRWHGSSSLRPLSASKYLIISFIHNFVFIPLISGLGGPVGLAVPEAPPSVAVRLKKSFDVQ